MQPPTDNTQEYIWPPAPTLAEPQPTDPVFQIINYKRMSTLLLFFLSVITLNLASYVWYCVTAKRAKEAWPNVDISPLIFIGIGVVGLVFGVVSIALKLPFWFDRICNLAIGIVSLYQRFILRNVINIKLGDDPRKRYWMGDLGTFFFGAIYMNYKLNRAMDAAKTIEGAPPA